MSQLIEEIPSRQEEEARIVGNFLHRLHEVLGDRRLSLFSQALAEAGISHAQLSTTEGLTLDVLDHVLGGIRAEIPDIILRLLKSMDLPDLGLIGYAALSCGNLEKALNILLRYQELTSDRYHDQTRTTDHSFIIRPVPRFRHLSDEVSIAEDCIAGYWRALELLLGAEADLNGAVASFAYSPPRYAQTYYEVLAPCKVKFEQEVNELRIPRSWLQRQVTSANVVMSGVTASVCERMLGPGRGARQDTPRAVRRLLLSRPGKRILRLEEAAEELLMSTSQLRKRLYRDGTSYKKIVLEVRMGLARHYLKSTPLTIQEIAFLLDYSQPGPFSRAFKSYYGHSPRTVREMAKA